MSFHVPARDNSKLKMLLERINADVELKQLWKCANVNAVDRSGISDHGEVHIRIVANAALKILRLLVDGGIAPSVVRNHGLTRDDAEVIVVLAACLHDIGISVHRDDHEKYSLWLAYPKARALLAGIYEEPALTIVTQETLHAIIAHDADQRCLTIEAGVVKVADTTDMTEGRSRIPFEAGQVNIHSVSALAIKDVKIDKGESRPVRISVTLSNSAGIFQLDNLLKHKLKNSTLAHLVEVVAQMEEGTAEKRLFEVYTL
ncbi:MAG: HD domain-containing protein [Kiritimatiellae bacterium]|nr:HD domain-containing protein [Kiritimatiellia bacterium]MDW8458763.1 HD domain-containing protein [Verrucomicrobiota bacterium]